jgi:hypothetical protein
MLVLKRFFPVAGSNAYSVPVEASIAHSAPAAVTGGARVGRPTCHATCIELSPTETAYKPSLQGTKTIDPSHAVPPHAPVQTRVAGSDEHGLHDEQHHPHREHATVQMDERRRGPVGNTLKVCSRKSQAHDRRHRDRHGGEVHVIEPPPALYDTCGDVGVAGNGHRHRLPLDVAG